jgi:hypothetical protein
MRILKVSGIVGFIVLCISFAFPLIGWAEPQLIFNVPGVCKVEADLNAMQLIFTAYQPGRVACEYSILAGNSYTQSEAGGWAMPEFRPAVKREPLPHYTTFIVTAGRYERIGVAICRENDRHIGCKVIR